jgi:hypothetical protein
LPSKIIRARIKIKEKFGRALYDRFSENFISLGASSAAHLFLKFSAGRYKFLRAVKRFNERRVSAKKKFLEQAFSVRPILPSDACRKFRTHKRENACCHRPKPLKLPVG